VANGVPWNFRQIEQWQCTIIPIGADTSNTTSPHRHRPWTIARSFPRTATLPDGRR
jgi:hypothetical protein